MEIIDYQRKYEAVYKEIVFKLNEEDEMIKIDEETDEKLFELNYKNGELEIEYEKLEENTIIEKIETIFSKIGFSLDEKQDIDKVLNLELIRMKWQKIKMGLFKENLLPDELEILYEFGALLENENNIIDILKGYYLYKYLFMGIYELSPSKLIINKKKEMKDLILGDVEFDIKMEYLEDEDEEKIILIGESVMERSYAGRDKHLIERGYLTSKDNGRLKYVLNGEYLLNEDKSIRNGKVDVTVTFHKIEMGWEGKVLLEVKHIFEIKEV